MPAGNGARRASPLNPVSSATGPVIARRLRRFGQIEVDPNTIIHFPLGIPGFEECKNYKLLHEDSSDPKVLWLQSLDEQDVLFTLIEAERLGLNYQLTLSDEECEHIELKAAEDAQLFLILSRPEGQDINANTRAPLNVGR